MKGLQILCASLAMMAGTAPAEMSPTTLLDYPLVARAPCIDNLSGEQGDCFLFDVDGTFYLVFAQRGNPVFVRRIKDGGGFEEVWRAKQGTPA